MSDDSEVIKLLTEMRDNQLKQMELNQKAAAANRKNAAIAGILIGVSVLLLILASRL
jgi:hypothetical protein